MIVLKCTFGNTRSFVLTMEQICLYDFPDANSLCFHRVFKAHSSHSTSIQSVTLNLGHTALIPVFLSSNVVLWWFFGGIVQVRGRQWGERKKEVAHNMSTLFLQLIQVLVIVACISPRIMILTARKKKFRWSRFITVLLWFRFPHNTSLSHRAVFLHGNFTFVILAKT